MGVMMLLHALLGPAQPNAEQAEPNTVRVFVHYDTGWGNQLTIRGSSAPLSWTAGKSMTWTSGNVWTWEAPSTIGDFEFKLLINDKTWSTGSNFKTTTAVSRSIHIYPFFGIPRGSMVTITNFYSPQLDNRRNLTLYLPPSYGENPAKRYPVVYMNDGQNLFDPRSAFGGIEWQVDEAIDRSIGQGSTRETIVVGINNTSSRISEYTPSVDPRYGGGNADAYLDFIQQTLKPYIDAHYRTLIGAPDTLMVGSSLGGLLSCYAGWTRSAIYGGVGCMSSSFWWDAEAFTHGVETYQGKRPVRFYMDAGGNNDGLTETVHFRDALLADGHVSGVDLLHVYDPSGKHTESSWARRLPTALQYLLPFDAEMRAD
ncbi:alpha/beta hydrolase-fold protein [Streptomyces sp. NBC_01077]|uniref:alpha/beta hydrolase-fold protein n=1 Tax=Streptomyces sp. NBC_01077 TaxID=2903746 RepID=UPI00386AF330|nr:alpha/beta hydrolase-fold protein [Streptomyces sp. NBC_01077]WSV43628.1 alpha/beta hydrolase-fold protein [Streptomyces sp. NBC_01077]